MAKQVTQDAKGLHYLMATVEQWRKDYDENKAGDIIFQHEPTLTNVRFTANSLHTIEKHARGFERIPNTVIYPDELWSLWEDPKTQRVVLRFYLSFGEVCYVVKTRDGIIMDAFAVAKKAINKYRKGVIL